MTIIIWGYRMWWHRRPTRHQFGFGRPFPRGAWRTVPRPALAILIVAGALLAWYLPVLGISLAGFLLLDALLGLRTRTKA
jgi:uncharacterized iron-regulated membrane protein